MTSPEKGIDALADSLRSWTRTHRAEGDELGLKRADIAAILGELGRLAQSNARLRKQNRRLRLRLARAQGQEEPDVGEDSEQG